MKIAHISTFPTMQCGIAFYVSDLIEALPTFTNEKYALHYGVNLTNDALDNADVSHASNLKMIARVISKSDCDVVSLQHEFGIWGGTNGEHIIGFLDELTKPIVSTLHTTFKKENRPPEQSSVLDRIVKQSRTNFVLTPTSRNTLCETLNIPINVVSVIPHGVPEITFIDPPSDYFDKSSKKYLWKLFTIGFFRPNKGFEEILKALSTLKDRGYNFQYVIAGSPQSQFIGQENYGRELFKLIDDLNLKDKVHIDARFLTRSEQIKLIQDSHVGIFAYQDRDQSSSGTIPLVMAAGRPVICTPFEFALAKKLEINDGINVAKDFNSIAIEQALIQFFNTTKDYERTAMKLHASAQSWSWKKVGRTYSVAFNRACKI